MDIGYDMGFGAHKVAIGSAESQHIVEVVSHVAAAIDPKFSELVVGRRKGGPSLVQLPNGAAYWVGAGAHDMGRPLEANDVAKLTGSPEVKAIMLKALSTVDHGGVIHNLAVGLPLSMLEAGSTYPEIVRRWLTGTAFGKVDGKQVEVDIRNVVISSQPGAAFAGWAYGVDGDALQPADVLAREVAVMSIGFGTVEMMVLRGAVPVPRFTASYPIGVRRYLELDNPNRSFSLGELDTNLRKMGKALNEGALETWSRELFGTIEERWGQVKNVARFGTLLVCGGGAILLKTVLRKTFPSAVILDDPVAAVAIGLQRIAHFNDSGNAQ